MPSFTKVKDAAGRERVLAACYLARGCYKLPGHPKSIHPGRVFSLAGLGVDATNWEHAKLLRRERRAKEWLKDLKGEGTPSGMEVYEEKRQAILDAIEKLNGKASWIAFDALVCSK